MRIERIYAVRHNSKLRLVKPYRLLKGLRMNRSMGAALMSALVFPGTGHFYLRRPVRACLFLLPALGSALVYFGDAASRASDLVDQVMAGRVAPDAAAMAAKLDASSGSAFVTACGWIFVLCWIGSIVDSFIVGRGSPPP
jgi:hypothetical protein